MRDPFWQRRNRKDDGDGQPLLLNAVIGRWEGRDANCNPGWNGIILCGRREVRLWRWKSDRVSRCV